MNLRSASHRLAGPAGEMEVYAAWPDAPGPLAPVVVLMDMWGFRETVRAVARQVAALGYYALLPDVYQRTDPVRLDDECDTAVVRKFADMPRSVQLRLRVAMNDLPDDDVVADVALLLRAAHDWGVPLKPHAGLVGYCMGGRHALCIAGALPELVRASACLHGTDLLRAAPRALPARGEIYCGHAELDEYAPPDVPQRLLDALAHGGAAFSQVVHAGAHHGYALQDRAIHDPRATARDWDAIAAMFSRQLA